MKHMLFFAGLFCAAFAFAWLFETGVAFAQSTGGDPFAVRAYPPAKSL